METTKVHYACQGTCGAVKAEPHTCATADCDHKGQAMEACTCSDKQHVGQLTHEHK